MTTFNTRATVFTAREHSSRVVDGSFRAANQLLQRAAGGEHLERDTSDADGVGLASQLRPATSLVCLAAGAAGARQLPLDLWGRLPCQHTATHSHSHT